MTDIFEALKAALAHHQARRFAEAEAGYRAVLAAEAEQPNALYLFGLMRLDMGRLDDAIDLLTRATARDPESTDSLFHLGNALYRKGDLAAATARYQEVLARRPGYAEGYANLARALQDAGRTADAIEAADKAATLKPTLAEAHTNLGTALLAADRTAEAVNAFAATVALNPRVATAQTNLANALQRAGKAADAEAAARAALALDPNLAEAHMLLGMALRDQGRFGQAIETLQRAVTLRPGHAQSWNNLGNALTDGDRLQEAVTAFERAIALAPDRAVAYSNLGNALYGLGRLKDAIAACERAIAVQPDFAEAHWNQGFAYLLAGDLARGWEKYEWRKRHPRFAAAYRHFPEPLWEGQELRGRTLLVHAEQGLGDSIQFIRYAAPLAERGARVIVACDRALVSLFGRVRGVAMAVDKIATLPPFDLWVDQMSLPRVMGTRLDTIPSPDRYLTADPDRVAAWTKSLPAGAKFGLVWAGNPTHSNDRRRSLPIEMVRPLLDIPGLTAVSLQVGARAQEIARLAPLPVVDVSAQLTDFEETAAAIANLDLVIAVDTAVAHLAGALGRPTWVLLPASPDWRWVLGRDDSPWYSSLRLFRQTTAGDWAAVITAVVAELRTGLGVSF